MLKSTIAGVVLGCVLVVTTLVTSVSANHAWSSYHWARTNNPASLTVVNSTVGWDGYVVNALADWSQSDKIDFVQIAGATGDKERRQCRSPLGQIRICNLSYGNNGWLGIAGISLDTDGHIVTGYTKLNDWYFNLSYYDTDDWRQSVMCQELGHDIGLDHQDEDFDNQTLHSCMDYQDPPWPSANAHDFAQLDTIYTHLDPYNSFITDGGGSGGGGCSAPPGKGCNKANAAQAHANERSGWGMSQGRRGRYERFMRLDPDGTRHITFVTWADGH